MTHNKKPVSNQFPVQPKLKAVKWALYYNGQEQIKGDYALCNWKKGQLLQGGGISKNLLIIKPIEFIQL